MDAEFGPLEVYDPAGDPVDGHDARVDPQDARVMIASLGKLPQGTCKVEWRVTSVDGHVVEGDHAFVVRPAASQTTRAEGGDTEGGEVETQSAENSDSGPGPGRVAALGYFAVSLVVLLVVVLRRSRS